tara:strand:+ start:1669 stop:2544 length:876 start_codon:yes stop_codon:yes gene_type:complete
MKKDKNFKPMLAHAYQQQPIDWGQPVYMQAKLDGVRCIFTAKGAFSRTGKRFMNVRHIEFELQDLFKRMPHLRLDGELYNHDLRDDFEKIISLVRKQTPTHEDRLEAFNMVQYHVYDMWFDDPSNITGFKWDYKTRFKWIQKNVTHCNHSRDRMIQVIKTHPCATPSMLKVMHAVFLEQGYEGSIIRLNGQYEHKRSKNLMKVKDFHDSEATIIDWVEGKGKREGTIGKFVAEDADGNQFGMPVMDKFKKLRRNFKEMQKWVGKIATFTYFERTKRMSYRHPLFKAIRNYE